MLREASAAAGIQLAPGADYPTYLDNIERTSSVSGEELINATSAPHLHLLWTFTASVDKQGIESQPIESGGIVYFGASSGYEYALYATNGTLVWRTFLGQAKNDTGCGGTLGVTSTASVYDGTLYVDGGYTNFYALNASTGAINWLAPIGNGTNTQGFYDWSSPLIYDGNAYVGISSQCDKPLVQAGIDEFSLASHKLDGYLDTSVPDPNGSSIWGSPSVNSKTNTIYVATGNQYRNNPPSNYSESVLAINATTLAVKASWQVPPKQAIGDSDFGVTPTLFTPAGGYPMVSAANKNGYLYVYYQSNLTLAWEYRLCCKGTSQDEHISTAWGGGDLYAVGSIAKIHGVTYNSSVAAFDPLTGGILWQVGLPETSYYGYAAPLYVNGLLVVGDQDALLVFNASTGSIVYQDTVGGVIVAAPSIARGEIYAASSDNTLYAFDTSLAVRATASTESGLAPLPVSFSANGSSGLPPYHYEWNFGDGGTATTQNPSHTFLSAGTYQVQAEVIDLAGNSSTTTLPVTVSASYSVTFDEAGLPSGSVWNATLDGALQVTDTSQISFNESNGTYTYSVSAGPGFSATPSSGSVTVNGSSQTVWISFASTFSVNFTETGLPSGTPWSVTLGGVNVGSTGSTITFLEVNGSYAYSIGIVPGWRTKPVAGSVVVKGVGVAEWRTFTEVEYVVTMEESGLPAGTSWNVTIGTTELSSTGTSVNFRLANGTYSYQIGAVTNYSCQATGEFSVSGSALVVKTHFTLVEYTVHFEENGLPAHTLWRVTIGGQSVSSSGRIITFSLSNGTYEYMPTSNNTTYTAGAGNVSVNGLGIEVDVYFTSAGPGSIATHASPEIPLASRRPS